MEDPPVPGFAEVTERAINRKCAQPPAARWWLTHTTADGPMGWQNGRANKVA